MGKFHIPHGINLYPAKQQIVRYAQTEAVHLGDQALNRVLRGEEGYFEIILQGAPYHLLAEHGFPRIGLALYQGERANRDTATQFLINLTVAGGDDVFLCFLLRFILCFIQFNLWHGYLPI